MNVNGWIAHEASQRRRLRPRNPFIGKWCLCMSLRGGSTVANLVWLVKLRCFKLFCASPLLTNLWCFKSCRDLTCISLCFHSNHEAVSSINEQAWHKNIHRENFTMAYLCRFCSYLFLFKLHGLHGHRRHKLSVLLGHALDLVRFVSGK
jgi:hypothetical protein